jgi:predicted AlkP superfamily pyrophosphatase or phosphodiesterase
VKEDVGLEHPYDETAAVDAAPCLPDYDGACINNIVPALLEHRDAPWLGDAAGADQVVLLLLDGLGWHHLQARRHLAPTLASMAGGPISTVLPTTTAAALTSLSTGETPASHGVLGYRMQIHGEVLNVLRWATAAGDARQTIPPGKVQTHPAFLGHRPPVVTRAEFAGSGFTGAHLDATRFTGYRMTSTLITELVGASRNGEPFAYGYYEGVDKVAHEFGLGEHFDAEVEAADQLVGTLLERLPSGTALVVTSDHGQVHVGGNLVPIHGDVMAHVSFQSGEGRFRWLHARPGRANALLDAARARHGDLAWVRSRDEIVDGGWFGPTMAGDNASRLGDVALVARADVAFTEPTDTGPYHLVGRHGSATEAEIRVPLLVAVA